MFTWRSVASTVLLMFSLIAACVGAPPQANPHQLKRYVSERPAFALFRPESWKVSQESSADALHIVVAAPDAASQAEIFFGDNRESRFDSLKLLAFKTRELKSHYPDLSVSEVTACKDLSCAVATISYTLSRVPVQGKFYFQTDPQQVVIRSYSAPASLLKTQRNLLLGILVNVHLGGPPPGQAQASSRAGNFPAAAPPLQVQLIPRRAPDGSLSISLPPDWNFQGQGGMAIATAPGGDSGFIFTVFQVMPSNFGVAPPPNVIISPYRLPSEFLPVIFQKFGNRDIRILGSNVDAQAAAACPGQTGRPCDAADVQLSWVSPKGASCAGSFKVLNARPNMMGQWFSIVAGIWGPADDLARYLPMLEQIGASFSINDRYARNYIQQGLARLRELQERTQRSIQGLNDARAQNQKDWEARQAIKDNTDSKWDDYRRGNSFWISEMEGGKAYKTDPWGTEDTQTGDRFEGAPHNYVNFEGQNPRHPSENMREVSSYELQRMMK